MIRSVLRPAASVHPYRAMSSKAPLLITPNALQNLRSSTSVDILDASWFMPNSPRDASKEFTDKRIPGARYLDLDEVAAPNELGLKHMMPSAEVFSDYIGKPIDQLAAQRRI